jgi:hypothetical protein
MNNQVVVIAVDRELAKSLAASARSKAGCLVTHEESEWRQELKELTALMHAGSE